MQMHQLEQTFQLPHLHLGHKMQHTPKQGILNTRYQVPKQGILNTRYPKGYTTPRG